ncbi:MAG: TolC family protein, partial [Chitinophagaceae bacterium]
MKIKHLLLATVLLASAASQAQDSTRAARPITLNEAVDLGIKNSHQLKNSTAKIEEATAAVREALDGRLPSAKASGSYLRVNNPSIKMKAEDNSGGGSNPDEPSTTPKVSQAMYGLVNFSLPVYTGGKIRYGIESSRLLAEATRLDAEHQREEVTQNIIEAYINLYKAKAAVDLVKENLAQNEQRVKDFRNLEKNGILARNDLLKAELQASNTELTLLDVENSWALANVNMDLMLGLPATTLLAPDSSITEVTTAVLPLDDYVTAALKGRKDIGAISLQRRASDNSVKIAKADKYPSLALTGGYVALDVPKFIAVTNAVNLGVGV